MYFIINSITHTFMVKVYPNVYIVSLATTQHWSSKWLGNDKARSYYLKKVRQICDATIHETALVNLWFDQQNIGWRIQSIELAAGYPWSIEWWNQILLSLFMNPFELLRKMLVLNLIYLLCNGFLYLHTGTMKLYHIIHWFLATWGPFYWHGLNKSHKEK